MLHSDPSLQNNNETPGVETLGVETPGVEPLGVEPLGVETMYVGFLHWKLCSAIHWQKGPRPPLAVREMLCEEEMLWLTAQIL